MTELEINVLCRSSVVDCVKCLFEVERSLLVAWRAHFSVRVSTLWYGIVRYCLSLVLMLRSNMRPPTQGLMNDPNNNLKINSILTILAN